MSGFKKGPSQILINSDTDFPIYFYHKLSSGNYNLIETDDTWAASAASVTEGTTFSPDTDGVTTNVLVTDLDLMKVVGFADFYKATTTKVVKTKGIAAQTQSSTLTVTIPTAVVNGKEVSIPIKITSLDNKGEYASYYSDYLRTKTYQIVIATGDTVTTIAAKIVTAINSSIEGQFQPLSATNSAGVVTIVPNSSETVISFALGTVVGATEAGIALAFATTAPAYEGRGTYYNLQREFIETSANQYPNNAYGKKMLPVSGAKYSSYTVTNTVARPDLGGTVSLNPTHNGTFDFVIYVNEALTATNAKLVAWFNANATTKVDYPATTAAGAIAAETAGTTLT